MKDPALEKPERTRVVLHPNSETLWADICLLSQKAGNQWTDHDAVEIEARLLVSFVHCDVWTHADILAQMATAPPLCLDPDPHLTRIANNVLRASIPTVPVSLKRKASALDAEEHESDKARRAKLMQYMNPRQHRSHAPKYFPTLPSVMFGLTLLYQLSNTGNDPKEQNGGRRSAAIHEPPTPPPNCIDSTSLRTSKCPISNCHDSSIFGRGRFCTEEGDQEEKDGFIAVVAYHKRQWSEP